MLKVPRPVPPEGSNRAGNRKSLTGASGSQITQSPRNQQGITQRSRDLLLPASAPFPLTPTDIVDRLFTGHAAQVLARFPEGCIDLIVTSPPYWTAVEYDQGKDSWSSYKAYLDDMQTVWTQCARVLGRAANSVSTPRSCRSRRRSSSNTPDTLRTSHSTWSSGFWRRRTLSGSAFLSGRSRRQR